MGKNADTIKMGGNRFDCGPSVIKQTDIQQEKLDMKLFIKSDEEEKTFLNGFEEVRKKITFQ